MVATRPNPREVLGRAIQVALSFIGPHLDMAVVVPNLDSDVKICTMKAMLPGLGVIQSSYTLDRVWMEFNKGPCAFSVFIRDWLGALEGQALLVLRTSLDDPEESPG